MDNMRGLVSIHELLKPVMDDLVVALAGVHASTVYYSVSAAEHVLRIRLNEIRYRGVEGRGKIGANTT